jgi:NADH-quinone oxidoreductase subunit N
LAMVVFLLSLGGIPPTSGFIGKYFLFYAAVGAGFGWLAVIAVLMSAVSMVYYLRIVMAMYFRDGKDAELAGGSTLKFVAMACLIITLFFGILPSLLIDQAKLSGAGVARRIANVRR